MNKRIKKSFIAVLVFVLCVSVSIIDTFIYAAGYPLPSVSESQLTDHRGDDVTGDDIVNTAAYLTTLGFTYENVGTCTGFVTRVLRHLQVGLPLVSRNSNWDYIYTDVTWIQKGYKEGAPAAWDPTKFKERLDEMCATGDAQYIGAIPYNKQDDDDYVNSLGIENGDLLITPAQEDKNGHVAFAYIYNGTVKSLGAGGIIGASDLKSSQSNKQGDMYVYRVVKAEKKGNLVIEKKDNYGVYKANATFHVVGPDFDQTITTDENGTCTLSDILIGTYTITEVNAPEYMLLNGQSAEVEVTTGSTTTYTLVNEYPTGRTRVHKVDSIEGENPKGDAKLGGAVYNLYANEDIYQGTTLRYSKDQLIKSETTDDNGYTAWVSGLPIGNYYWQESQASEGYLRNDEKLYVNIEYQGQSVDATNGGANDVEVTSLEEKKYNRARVIKMNNDSSDSSEKSPAVGAILRLYLVSDESQYYDAVIGEDGTAEFIDEEFAANHPDTEYTIPYGTYKIKEIKESDDGQHTHFFIQEYTLELTDQNKTETVIVVDEAVATYVKVVKTDAITGKTVELAGAKFKIWDCQNNEFVTQMESPSGNYISEFETNEKGYFNTLQKLNPGQYVIYETKAPEGYALNDEWKLPDDEKDYGNSEKGGKLIDLNKPNIGIEEDTPYDKDSVIVYRVDMPDYPLMVKLNINKTGEKLSEVKTSTVNYPVSETENNSEEKYTPIYKLEGLQGVTYNVVAATDIKSPDGKGVYCKEGTIVDTITTDETGNAVTKNIYPGTYKIEEVVTPVGYLKDTDIPNVTLTNTDSNTPVKTYNKELSDVRQKLELTFKKQFEDVKFSTGEEITKKAIFGVYTKTDIKDSNGKVVIGMNKLVDLIEIDKNDENVTSNVDLPEGEYYVKELYASYPYTKSEKVLNFNLKYNNNSTQEFVVYEGDTIVNKSESTSVTLVKLSTATVDDLILNGKDVDTSNLDEKVQEILDKIKGMTTEEIKSYFEKNDVKFVAGAVYGIYTDEECKNQLKIYNETTGTFENAELVTDNSGLITLDNIPLGQYYIKEISAPSGYEVSDQVTSLDLSIEDKDTRIYKALIEDLTLPKILTKTDIFTGEAVPNCVFEIKDEDGKVLMHSVTDAKGEAFIPQSLFENGKKYTFTEIEAPDIYNLNTEPHEFIAKIDEDGNWATEPIEVSNYRKTSTVELTKLDMVDSTPIPNCKFELRSLETDFVVEGVTDENGVYVFKDIPYGKYTYTELEAPEEYLIDTTPHEITIDAEDIKIVVKDERAPDTGDIAVAALVVVAVVCVLGIVFVIVKNKKKNK